MEQFLRIAPNIVRCTYTPGGEIHNTSRLVDSKYLVGEACADFMNPVKSVSFTQRDIYHFSKAFKQHFGQSPRSYQKMYKGESWNETSILDLDRR